MNDGVRFDFSDIGRLADDLDKAVDRIPAGTRASVQKGSLNIKTDWRHRWSTHPHIRQIVPTITYDTIEAPTSVIGEIGPDRARGAAAALANIPEFGTLKNAPIPGGIPALAAEEPRFEKAMQDLAAKALGL